jgi:hypothetical protein
MNPRGLIVLIGILAAAPCRAADVPSYSVEVIPQLPGSYATQLVRLNNAGTVIGQARGPQLEVRSWVWSRATGTVEILPPAGFTDIRVEAISDNGIIAGSVRADFYSQPRAFRLEAGAFTLINPPPTSGGLEAYGVNDNGDLVGMFTTENLSQLGGEFYYSDELGIVDIAPGQGTAWDINNFGVVTGMTGDMLAYRWSLSSGFVLIPHPPEWDGAEGLRINDLGHVAGRVIDIRPGRDPSDSFLARDNTMELISGSGWHQSRPLGLNNLDQVIGADGTESTPLYTPYLWLPGKGRIDFTAVETTPPLTQIMIARDINDRGQVIVRVYSPEIGDVPALFTPIGCGTADFNGDSDFGTDQDIEAFFACLAGSCCPSCFPGGADFNRDGDSGTDQDIEAFFRVLSGGPC